MKKALIWLTVFTLCLSICGINSNASAEWNDYRLEAGEPDVYVFSEYGRWGLADADKNELLDAHFEFIRSFQGDYAVACYTDYTATPEDVSGVAEYPQVQGVIDRKGQTVIDFVYSSLIELDSGNYLAQKDKLWGMLAPDGSVLLDFVYSRMDTIIDDVRLDGYVLLRQAIDAQSEVLYGMANDAGEIVIPVEYYHVDVKAMDESSIVSATYKNQIAQYRLENGQAVKLDADILLESDMYIGGKICDAPAIYLYEVGNLCGLVDGNGGRITEPVYAKIDRFCGGHAVAAKFDYSVNPASFSGENEYPLLYGVIDTQGAVLVDFTYEKRISLSDDGQILRFEQESDDVANYFGYKNLDGETIIDAKYAYASDFVSGVALVAEFSVDPNGAEDSSAPSGKYYYGLIDTAGKVIVPLDYESGEYYAADGVYVLSRNDTDEYYSVRNGAAEKLSRVASSFSLEAYYPFEGESVAKLSGEASLSLSEAALPRLDGATALFPVYSAVAEAVYPDTTRYVQPDNADADSLITCTKTDRAYDRLIDGEADIIFAAEPFGKQLQAAKEKGVEFELTPFGREAFVFIVNSNNPLESISIEQIQKVYSGEMTDWSDLGVSDLGQIIAYQRPENSGSQTALEKLMGDVPLMDAPATLTPSLMEDILETIEYRSLPNAIGYSFRFFCTNMAQSNVKLLAVDGAAPSEENVRSESYPLCSTLYMVSRKGEENPNVQALIDWVLSGQGRELIEKSGYVALN